MIFLDVRTPRRISENFLSIHSQEIGANLQKVYIVSPKSMVPTEANILHPNLSLVFTTQVSMVGIHLWTSSACNKLAHA